MPSGEEGTRVLAGSSSRSPAAIVGGDVYPVGLREEPAQLHRGRRCFGLRVYPVRDPHAIAPNACAVSAVCESGTVHFARP